ncbi:hypothetical protein Trydic_g16531 [Trypoxylus dichotomus]
MEKRLFGLHMKDERRLAYQLPIHNNIPKCEMAGKDWMAGFLTRHPDISVRSPEAASGVRAMGVSFTQFHTLLTECIDKYKLAANKIFNCDETGIAKQQQFQLGLPLGGWTEVTKSSYNMRDFLFWFKDFIAFSKSTRESPSLLLFDGHVAHTKNIELIDLDRDNGFVLLRFSPHCSHNMQSLDVALMRPISVYYKEEAHPFQRHLRKTFWQFQKSSKTSKDA